MKNREIREACKLKKVYLYTVADRMNISEATMTRLLRKELPQAKKDEILKIIDELSIAHKD